MNGYLINNGKSMVYHFFIFKYIYNVFIMKDKYCQKDHTDLTPEEVVEIANKLNKIIDKKIDAHNGWWAKLLNKNDNSVSSSSFYLISVTLVGLLLLLVPMVVLIIEVIYNHTIQTDLSGMAAYIGSVAGLFATGGIVKGWISYNDSKTNIERYKQEKYVSDCEHEPVESEGD